MQLDTSEAAREPTVPTPLTVNSVPRRVDAILLALGGTGIPNYHWLGWAWLGAFVVLLTADESWFAQRLFSRALTVILVLLLVGTLWMFASWPLRFLGTLLRCLRTQQWQPQTFTLAPEYLRVETANRREILDWPGVRYVAMDGDRILIHLAWGRYLHVSKRDFANEVDYFGFYAALIRYWAAHLTAY